MTKIRVKQKQLAKLREFRKGMDIEEYLLTEYRQLLRALQNQYVEVDSTESGDVVVNRGASILWGSNQSAISDGVIPLVNGGNVFFDSSLGQITTNVFYPAVDGKYFIKFGYRHESNLTGGTGASNSTSIEVFDSSSTSIGLIDCRHITPSASASLDIRGASGGLFVDLSPSLGFYFNVARSGTGSPTVSKFYCELTKVSE